MKPLYIPKNKKIPGLVVYCLKCRTNMTEECKLTGNTLKHCKFGDKHRFKIYVQVPGTTQRVTKTFETRNFDEAIKEAIIFRESVIKNSAQKQHPEPEQKIQTEEKPVLPPMPPPIQSNSVDDMPLLTEALARHFGFYSADETVACFERRNRSKDYLAEISRAYTRFASVLQKRYDLGSLRVNQMTKEMVGMYYDFMQSKLKYAPRSLNKNIGFINSFFIWLNKQGYSVYNPFATVVRKPEITKIETITKEEFEQLLEKITPENGIEHKPGKVRNYRSHYRTWLKQSCRLAIECGRRREELAQMKWSDLILDSSGNPTCIKVFDIKVNHIRGVEKDEEKKVVFVPITENLMQLLNELGYEKNKNSGKYILAPELKSKRGKVLCDTMSRSFAHYIKLTGVKKNLSFKCLRKTYITNLAITMGSRTAMVTGHSGNDILQRHYINQFEIAQSLRNFSVFGNKEPSRLSELNTVRENQKKQEVSLEK